jgi:hypothetical protein
LITAYFRLATLMTLILTLPILVIRAGHFENRATSGLVQENCLAPCFMGIRPGWTSMRDTYYLLAAHDWVANSAQEFPSLLRESSLIGAGIPRTMVRWRWSAQQPDWIDEAVQGAVILQDRDVLSIHIETSLLLGEIILAFGHPDEWRVVRSDSQGGQSFDYTAWYAREGLLIRAEGICPSWQRYHRPVRIIVSAQRPVIPHDILQETICR